MKHTARFLGAASVIPLFAASSPAWAVGTQAGNTITNNVTVDYQVGGVSQTAATDTDAVTVDRKVNVTVAEVGGAATSVVPGQTEAATTFQITNLSNDAVDFALSVIQSASDDFDLVDDVSNPIKFYLDDGDGVYGAGDTEITYLDEVAASGPGSTLTVHVVGKVPLGATNGQQAAITLVANAHAASGTPGSLGTELTATAGANTAGVDTVLADGAGPGDSANQGDFSATDSYIVSAAQVTANKTSSIVSDPVNGTTNPKAIPGATIEYCILVSNGSGAATASGVTITDALPADVTYDSGFGIFVDGDGSCASGASGGSYNSGTNEVSGALSDIAGGSSRSLYFRVTIN